MNKGAYHRAYTGVLFRQFSTLPAELFFSRNGFAVETRQQVALRGAVLANARMAKGLAGN